MSEPHYTIDPLEWRESNDAVSELYHASVPMGSFTVERNREGWEPDGKWSSWRMRYCFDEYYDESESEVDSLEDGKQKAWAEWLSRITGALTKVS